MRVLVLGCGGVGSFLTPLISKALLYDQLGNGVEVVIADNDSVEPKNLSYQNFSEEDLLQNKAEILGKRYTLGYINKRITKPKELDGYDVIILAVDNSETRKMVYNHCKGNGTFWIDARATDRSIAIFTKSDRNTPNAMEEFTGDVKDRSCQFDRNIAEKKVNYAHVIAGSIAFQILINHARKEKSPDTVILRF
jgi:molybdopterin/thiamine biosynthesis adenylyltransferase